MPVITLPTDTRWGQLGAGLGALLGQVVQARRNNQIAQGVGAISQDPNIPDNQKLPEVLRQYGDQGANIYTQIIRSQVLQGQLQLQGSEEQKNRAQTGLYGAEAAAYPAKMQGALDKQTAETQLAQARIPLVQAQIGATGASERRNQATADLDTAKLQREQQQSAAQGGAGSESLDAALAPFNPTPDQVAQAKSIYRGAEIHTLGSGQLAATNWLSKQTTEKGTPPDIRKSAAEAAEAATSASRYLDTFEKNPSSGLFTGATIKAYAEGKGLSTGDADLLNKADAGLLQAADAMKQTGGGFGWEGRWKLARDVTATIADSPLRAIINMDQVSERRLADLNSYKLSQPANVTMRDVDASIKKWEAIKQRTAAYRTYTTQDGHTVVEHNGNVLDAKNFNTLLLANKVYVQSGPDTVTGAQIAKDAENRAMNPFARLQEIKDYYAKHPRSTPIPAREQQ
jgi:hypothetical protein